MAKSHSIISSLSMFGVGVVMKIKGMEVGGTDVKLWTSARRIQENNHTCVHTTLKHHTLKYTLTVSAHQTVPLVSIFHCPWLKDTFIHTQSSEGVLFQAAPHGPHSLVKGLGTLRHSYSRMLLVLLVYQTPHVSSPCVISYCKSEDDVFRWDSLLPGSYLCHSYTRSQRHRHN